ncbi:FecR domain-containing protein [Pandoraea commovens]|uniref:FecR domain-containing protein n=1 Tax=Pandoraea commovens TaxID=2508289 RepID=A0ABY5QEP5_9BURK|nr:FecR domain-containing protein [Pandoraea commovens]UVA79277.1 FecR domain-containing protein [Pandoraea commovens]
MTRSATFDATIAQQAVEWWVTLQSGDATETLRTACARWRAANPEHERAWLHIENADRRMRHVSGTLGAAVAQAALRAPRSRGRRMAVKAIVGALFVGTGAWVASDPMAVQWLRADARTGAGERRTLRLSDGTTLVLNTRSAVRLSMDGDVRRIGLVEGEIMVTTGKDVTHVPPRPLIVATAHGTLQPLGTRFVARQIDGQIDGRSDASVQVFEGAVRVTPKGTSSTDTASVRIVHAGEQATFNASGVEAALPLADGDGAWADGMLVAVDMRLDTFLAELSRYRRGYLRCDPAVASLRVSGTYPLADIDAILGVLPHALPVSVSSVTRYWVTVGPRG